VRAVKLLDFSETFRCTFTEVHGLTSSGTREQRVASGTREQRVASGTREQCVTSGIWEQCVVPGIREQCVTSGTREQRVASGTLEQCVAPGTREQCVAPGTREQRVASGTRRSFSLNCCHAEEGAPRQQLHRLYCMWRGLHGSSEAESMPQYATVRQSMTDAATVGFPVSPS
jgi:hypothetical protein